MTRRYFLKIILALLAFFGFPRKAKAVTTITGSCNHCGKCCQPPIMGNPLMIDPASKVCWFYDPTTSSGKFRCRLYDAKPGTYKKVPLRKNDPDFGYCTEEMYDYLQNECKPYPNGYTTEQLNEWGDRFKLPIECGFLKVQG